MRIERASGKGVQQRFRLARMAGAIRHATAGMAVGVSVLMAPPIVQAQTGSLRHYDIAAGSLEDALNHFGVRAGITLSFPGELAAGQHSNGLQGDYSIADGLNRLLAGTGLHPKPQPNGSYLLEKSADTAPSPAPSAQAQVLPAVVVTTGRDAIVQANNPPTTIASKIPLEQREIPQSVTVVTQKQIEEQNLRTLDDAMQSVPGVTVNLINPNDTAYYSRGFPISTFQLDGVPTVIPSSGGGTIADDLAMYESVEVLRGPAGLFNGLGGDGGVINLVRKHAPAAFQASAEVSAGNYANRIEQVDIGGPLNAAGTLKGRLVAMQHDQGLLQDGAWQRDQQVYGTLEADLTPNTIARVGASYTKTFGHVMYGIPAYSTGYGIVDVPRSAYIGADWDKLENEKTNAFAELEQKLGGGWKAKLAFNYTHIYTHYLNGIPGSYVDPETDIGDLYSYNYKDSNTQEAVDLYASGPFKLFGRTHQLTVGANYMHQTDRSTQYFVNPATGLDVWGDVYTSIYDTAAYSNDFTNGQQNDFRSTTNQYGVYGDARFSLADPLTLIVGGRVTWWNTQLTPNANPDYNYFGENAQDDRVGPKFTPFVGLVYDIDDRYSAYASYTSIYKPQTDTYTYDGKIIKPVTGEQYEVGLKGAQFGGRLNTSIALFQITEENRAFSDPAHQGFYLAQGRARSRGVELQASGQVLPNWTVGGGYTYTMAEALDTSETFGSPISMTTPRHLFKLWTNYRLPGTLNKWSIGGSMYVTSATSYTIDDTGSMVAPGYATFNANVGYQATKSLSALLSVTNLTDRTYIRTASGAGGYYYGNPLEVMLTLRYKM